MSRLRRALESGDFVITGEVAPPHGTDLAQMKSAIELLGPHCVALNLTDNQSANLHLSSMGAAHAVISMGYEPIFQVTARDRNRLALQSDLLAAWTLGIENVLMLTGDDPRFGDHPECKGVFDVDSSQLLAIAGALNDGRDMEGRELEGGTAFFLGAATFPEAEPWDIQLRRTATKVEAGAMFFQTQAVFDMDKLARAVEAVHALGRPVIAGVIVLKGAGVIRFINERLPGLMVPDAVAERIVSATSPLEESVDYAVEQVKAIRDIADGVHIMALGLDARVPEIIERAEVR